MLWLVLACAPEAELPNDGSGFTDPYTDVTQVGDAPWEVQRLRWIRGYEPEDWERAQQGLWWSLAVLGAVPPEVSRAIHVVSESDDEVVFDLDLVESGLPERALGAIRVATEDTLASDERAIWGSVDLGRWIMRLVYEPWVYYAATGTCRTLDGWTSARLEPQPLVYGVTVSNLEKDKHRLLELNPMPGAIEEIAFRATEGSGSIVDGTFEPLEFEILDVLPNGLHHYAVYDGDGALLPGGTPGISTAGQPGRCMWCHEGQWVQRGSDENVSPEPYLSYGDFQIESENVDVITDARRKATNSIVDFPQPVHTWGEWLANMFLDSSPERLAREWHTTPEEVDRILLELDIATVPSGEYPDLGPAAARRELDEHAATIADQLAAIAGHPFEGWSGGFTPIATQPVGREYDPETQVLFESDELLALLLDCE
jgi:hypothetical protein